MGKIGEGWCNIDPNELLFTFGVLMSVPFFVKSINKCNLESAHRWTHTLTD